jgi:kinesin family protein C1
MSGYRLTETIKINKRANSLSNAIPAFANKKIGNIYDRETRNKLICYKTLSVVFKCMNPSFKNKKLGFLGGDCKTLMFVNVSPLKEHLNESNCSHVCSRIN